MWVMGCVRDYMLLLLLFLLLLLLCCNPKQYGGAHIPCFIVVLSLNIHYTKSMQTISSCVCVRLNVFAQLCKWKLIKLRATYTYMPRVYHTTTVDCHVNKSKDHYSHITVYQQL